MIYANRTNITMMNAVRRAHGLDRSAQTNSRRNGNYCIVRLYEHAEDKGRPAKAVREIETPAELRAAYSEIA